MDQAITYFMTEYHVLVKNVIFIGGLIVCFVCISGCIRFGIASYRRHKGIYPPATSMEEHH